MPIGIFNSCIVFPAILPFLIMFFLVYHFFASLLRNSQGGIYFASVFFVLMGF